MYLILVYSSSQAPARVCKCAFSSQHSPISLKCEKYILVLTLISLKKGALTRYGKINIGVCLRLDFDYITLINFLGYDFYIYGAFEGLCVSIVNL